MTHVEQDSRGAALAADNRRHPRHLCMDGQILRLAVRPEFRGRRALLVDVSAGGIAFLLQDTLEAGTVLVFEVQGQGGADTVSRIARVRHCQTHAVPAGAPWLPPTPTLSRFFRTLLGLRAPNPPGQAWLVGCEFDRPLDESEINQLLEQLKSLAQLENE